MDLDDVLEAIGKILGIIGLFLVIFLGIVGIVAIADCLLDWLFAVVAFIQGNIALGLGLLIVL